MPVMALTIPLQSLTVSITNLNDNTPVITSVASYTADENQTAMGTSTYSDADGAISTYTFSLTGTDASSLSINSLSLESLT